MQSFFNKCWATVKQPKVSSLIAVALGTALSVILPYIPITRLKETLLSSPEELLMRLIESVTVPHMMTHLIIARTRSRPGIPRNIAIRAAVYFFSTTVIAVTIGVTLVVLFKPGVSGDGREVEIDDDSFSSAYALMDLLRNMAPPDLMLATFRTYKTHFFKIDVEADDQYENHTEMRKLGEYVDGVNIVGLVVWMVIIGIILRRMGEQSTLLVDVIIAVNMITSRAVQHIMGCFPIGLLFMTAKYVDEVGVSWETFSQLGKFTAVVVAGLTIHGAVVLLLIYLLIVRRNPFTFVKGIFPALKRAMHFSRSSATPLSLHCCEDVHNMDRGIAHVMLTIGSSVKQDGTALYEVVAAVFIAQLSHINLNWSQLLTLCVTVLASSSGESGPQGTELVTIIFALGVLGIPASGICHLVIVHSILDLLCSPVNVLRHCIGAAVVEHISKKELEEMDERGLDMARDRTAEVGGESEETTE